MTDDKLRLGGMALRNGLLVHGPTHWAAAVRASDGSIARASGRKPRIESRWADVPGARGVVRLGEAMLVIPLVKRALPAAQLPYQDAGVGLVTAGTFLASTMLRRRGGSGARTEAALAAMSLAPAIFALRGGELAAYHGAEHKTIGAYEQGAQAQEATKEHDRCGSHLMAPLLAANVAGTTLLSKVVERPKPAQNAAVQLASIGIAVEVFAWSERHAGSRASQMLQSPGDALQRVVGTREPTAEQLAVGAAALEEILAAEGAVSST